ncbi:uncharacterized protein PV07_01172 [Cladophialophora immunda]|uniref:Uncharacterized protein n=1 Tax=Cladophialophora immunda TaxID=569365 RepID=A0A0D2DFB3_9EURO|nr:uncharacterized protein PV07_01172 [Cladophialophora immunda]KIW34394.1 hypothetical protein PV07_01172 [Cladophialophora immunda]OQV10273.1 hypothetical protein CLAIMM_14296 [Cladophialophora immunda]
MTGPSYGAHEARHNILHELSLTYMAQGRATNAANLLETILPEPSYSYSESFINRLVLNSNLAMAYAKRPAYQKAVPPIANVNKRRNSILPNHPAATLSQHDLFEYCQHIDDNTSLSEICEAQNPMNPSLNTSSVSKFQHWRRAIGLSSDAGDSTRIPLLRFFASIRCRALHLCSRCLGPRDSALSPYYDSIPSQLITPT